MLVIRPSLFPTISQFCFRSCTTIPPKINLDTALIFKMVLIEKTANNENNDYQIVKKLNLECANTTSMQLEEHLKKVCSFQSNSEKILIQETFNPNNIRILEIKTAQECVLIKVGPDWSVRLKKEFGETFTNDEAIFAKKQLAEIGGYSKGMSLIDKINEVAGESIANVAWYLFCDRDVLNVLLLDSKPIGELDITLAPRQPSDAASTEADTVHIWFENFPAQVSVRKE